jgi:hypothetical protein
MIRNYERNDEDRIDDIDERNYQYRRDREDRREGWWAGILPVLLIPLLLLGAGFALYNAFNSGQMSTGTTASTKNPANPVTSGNEVNSQVGIGGAPNTAVTMTVSPSPRLSPTHSVSPTSTMRDNTSNSTTYGVGGGPGNTSITMPTAAPRTGGGGLSR